MTANKASDGSSGHYVYVFFLPLKISDIESRIAALSAAGLTVKSVEKTRKKSSEQVSMEDRGYERSQPRDVRAP